MGLKLSFVRNSSFRKISINCICLLKKAGVKDFNHLARNTRLNLKDVKPIAKGHSS